jgi:signal transduction histidine kinase
MSQGGPIARRDDGPGADQTGRGDATAATETRHPVRWARSVEAALLSRPGVALACVLLVALLGLNALAFHRATQALLAQERGVTRAQDALIAIAAAMGDLTAAESAQRGYILYGDPADLRGYDAAARAVGPRLAHLRGVASDTPDQARRAAALVPLADAKLADLAQAIALRRTGQGAQARDMVVRDRDARATAALQGLFDALARAALAQLRRRDTRAQATAATTTVALVLATAVDAALLVGALLAIRRAFARRARVAAERGRLLAEARRARAAAEAAVKTRNDFLTVAAHDLRTPLTNMLGRSYVLGARLRGGQAPDPAWLIAQTASLEASTRRLIATVNELNDMIALERGEELALSPESVELGALARAVADEMATGIGAQGLGAVPIALDTSAGPVVVAADRGRLARVLQNVLGNAVKYSVRGTPVRVVVRRAGARAVVTVRDEGVGIPADELPRIFERFYRASTARGITGSGIGLAGAKATVEQHGGAIAVESAVGAGTTVTITLPVPAADDDGDAGAARARPR